MTVLAALNVARRNKKTTKTTNYEASNVLSVSFQDGVSLRRTKFVTNYCLIALSPL